MSLRNTRTRFQRLLDLNARTDCVDGDGEVGRAHSTAFYISGSVTSGTDSRSAGAIYANDIPETSSLAANAKPSISVTEELGDLSGLTIAQLNALRRSFARNNHPDLQINRNSGDISDRMSLANRLIDDAIKGIRRSEELR